MEKEIWIRLLLAISAALFFSSFIWLFYRWIRSRSKERPIQNRLLTTIGFFVLFASAIAVLKFVTGYYVSDPDVQPLAIGEEIVNSLFGALRTFSIEEEYSELILDVKALICKVIPEGSAQLPYWQVVAVVYASLLSIIAPIAGGAVIINMLASLFPMLKLLIMRIIPVKKFYFSELNAGSLALAKSIRSRKKIIPVLIFTDTYVDDEKEKEYELLLEAKRYGAICVRDDLAHVAKPIFGKCEYYLMDENEMGNLQTLMGLVEDNNIRHIKNSRIYLFVQSDAYVQVEKNVNKKLTDRIKDAEKPVIVPIRGYRNLVNNLLVDVPLYEPLIHKKDPACLKVTILGNGTIGTEAFLSTYWFGQMMVSQNGKAKMSQCDVTVNVVSKDTEEVFWSKIDYINPEIRKTVEVLGEESGRDRGDILCYDRSGKENKPYLRVRYTQSDVKIGGFWNGEIEEGQQLLDSDYFIVALGNDADNISIAERLRCAIGKKHLEDKSDDGKNTVISYVVFNSELSQNLNEQKCYQCRDKNKTDIYMYAFGSLEQVYSCENIYMSQSMLVAEETGSSYQNAHRNAYLDENRLRSDNEESNYRYWASHARAMHMKYKVFSLGWLDTSVFDCLDEADLEKHRDIVRARCKQYKTLCTVYRPDELLDEDKLRYADMEEKKHLLAWLEHRRWCAFTRTMGYQYESFENNFKCTGTHKNMPLKLHACLVEARLPANGESYILAKFSSDREFDKFGKVEEGSAFNTSDKSRRDRLDEVSFALHEHKSRKDDFKAFDYCRYEFGDYIFLSDLEEKLKAQGICNAKKYCKLKLYSYIDLRTGSGTQQLVSVESVKKELRKKYTDVGSSSAKGAFEFDGVWFASKHNARSASEK